MKPNYQNADMLDMVFEGRNQAYGAYVLRRDYDKSLQQAVMITLSVAFLLLFGNYLYGKINRSNVAPEVFVNVITSGITPPKIPQPQKQEIKLPPQKPEAKAKAAVQDLEKTVVRNEQPVQDSIPSNKDLQLAEASTTTNNAAPSDGIGTPNGNGTTFTFEVQKPAPPVLDEGPTRTPDIMPEFPGGEKALLAYLAKHTEFPSQMRDMWIGGQVISEFTISETGSVSDVHIIRSPSAAFNREVVRVINTLPAFKPGLQNGRPVKVRYVVPMFFKLSD